MRLTRNRANPWEDTGFQCGFKWERHDCDVSSREFRNPRLSKSSCSALMVRAQSRRPSRQTIPLRASKNLRRVDSPLARPFLRPFSMLRATRGIEQMRWSRRNCRTAVPTRKSSDPRRPKRVIANVLHFNVSEPLHFVVTVTRPNGTAWLSESNDRGVRSLVSRERAMPAAGSGVNGDAR
jgi:hypothetical protein